MCQRENLRVCGRSTKRGCYRLDELWSVCELNGCLLNGRDRSGSSRVKCHRGYSRNGNILVQVYSLWHIDRGSWQNVGIKEVEEHAYVQHEVVLPRQATAYGTSGKQSRKLVGPSLDKVDCNESAHRSASNIDAGRFTKLRSE